MKLTRRGFTAMALFCLFSSPISATAQTPDPQEAEAVALVAAFMRAHAKSLQGAASPLQMPLAREFFFAEDVGKFDPANLGFDPVLGGQDGEIIGLEVIPHPEERPLRGMYPVLAHFTSFGRPREITFYLRVDISIAPQMRILQFVADGEAYPK